MRQGSMSARHRVAAIPLSGFATSLAVSRSDMRRLTSQHPRRAATGNATATFAAY